jgi:peptidoglycan hydrolase CwlO-like protein
MFDEEEDDDLEPHVHLQDDGMMDFEWMDELAKIHAECEQERAEREQAEKKRQAALKAAATRRKNEWAKQDAEKKARRGKQFRSIDDQWEAQ